MTSDIFTAQLLRSSASGFAAMAASRVLERQAGDSAPDFELWQAHFTNSLLELAAAVDDGGEAQFAARMGWYSRAFAARGHATDVLRLGLDELHSVLKESMPSDSWASLPTFFEAARKEIEQPSGKPEHASGIHAALIDGYLELLRKGDGSAAIELVVDAVEKQQLTAVEALLEVVTGALREIGSLWHSAKLNVAEEHFATLTTGRLLERLILLAPKPTANGRSVMLTMVEGDAHVLGIGIVAAMFELDGWMTICLGANTPAGDLVETTELWNPDLVLIGATLNTQRGAVQASIAGLKAVRPGQLVVVGGPAFVALEGRARELGADGCALGPADALRVGNELLGL